MNDIVLKHKSQMDALAGKPLSKREREVLGWLYFGKTTKEIASFLHISEFTAKNHIQKILAKLCVLDRTRAVTIALEKGIIEVRKEAA